MLRRRGPVSRPARAEVLPVPVPGRLLFEGVGRAQPAAGGAPGGGSLRAGAWLLPCILRLLRGAWPVPLHQRGGGAGQGALGQMRGQRSGKPRTLRRGQAPLPRENPLQGRKAFPEKRRRRRFYRRKRKAADRKIGQEEQDYEMIKMFFSRSVQSPKGQTEAVGESSKKAPKCKAKIWVILQFVRKLRMKKVPEMA